MRANLSSFTRPLWVGPIFKLLMSIPLQQIHMITKRLSVFLQLASPKYLVNRMKESLPFGWSNVQLATSGAIVFVQHARHDFLYSFESRLWFTKLVFAGGHSLTFCLRGRHIPKDNIAILSSDGVLITVFGFHKYFIYGCFAKYGHTLVTAQLMFYQV